MLGIIKSKGFSFFIKRLIDKSLNKLSLYRELKNDTKISTYSNDLIDFSNINFTLNHINIDYEKLAKEKIIEYSDLICEHKFNLLGSGLQEISYYSEYKGFERIKFENKIRYKSNEDIIKQNINPTNLKYSLNILSKLPSNYKLIDWSRDFRSGYRWDNKLHHTQISYGNIEGVDVKIPWELGRLNHFLILFYAYKLSNNSKYADEFINQTYDFICQNPPQFGVQWKSAMDVALRAVSLVISYSLFSNNGYNFDEIFKNSILNYLTKHLEYILNNLEWSSGMRANHYYSNLCGIIFLTAFLPANKHTAFAFIFALNEFQTETIYQFYEDGGNFEGSLPYHSFMSEMLFSTFQLLKNIPKEKIWNIVNHFKNDTKRNFKLHRDLINRTNHIKLNELIQNNKIKFNDNFINRIEKIAQFTVNSLSPKNRDFQIGDNDNGYFLRIYPQINDDYSIDTNDRSELFEISHNILKNHTIPSSIFMKDFGIYFNNYHKYKIAIRCGQVGQNGKGGHSHNDQLSFELYSGENLLICDAGTYNYTASTEQRNTFRATKSHNTLQINDLEQNPISNNRNSLFWLNDTTKAECKEYSEEYFKGVHYGFGEQTTREFNFEDNKIIVSDICNIIGNKLIRFHLIPETKIIETSRNSVKLELNKQIFIIKHHIGEHKIEKYDYSPSYGVKYSSNLIVISFSENEIKWEIEILQ